MKKQRNRLAEADRLTGTFTYTVRHNGTSMDRHRDIQMNTQRDTHRARRTDRHAYTKNTTRHNTNAYNIKQKFIRKV